MFPILIVSSVALLASIYFNNILRASKSMEYYHVLLDSIVLLKAPCGIATSVEKVDLFDSIANLKAT